MSLGQSKAQQASNALAHRMCLDIYSDPMRLRKTGIICTIGGLNVASGGWPKEKDLN